jgi:adhesin transport system membrane fusion protein
LRRQEAELEAKIVTVKNRYFQDAHAEYAQVEEEYERLRQLLVQKQRALSQSRIPAPSRGLITNTRVNMIGSVVRPGDPLMELVPIDDELIVEVKVATSDIGFLEEGQLGVIKVDAFDYTIYGDLEGELIYISADAVDEETPQGLFSYYKVKVKARSNRFSKSPRSLVIIPGMSVTVEIRTGSSSVLEYMLKPIVKTLSESLTER